MSYRFHFSSAALQRSTTSLLLRLLFDWLIHLKRLHRKSLILSMFYLMSIAAFRSYFMIFKSCLFTFCVK